MKFDSKQQSLHWDSIKPSVIVGREQFPLRQTKLMRNRWEGLIPVPANASEVSYFYKFVIMNTTILASRRAPKAHRPPTSH